MPRLVQCCCVWPWILANVLAASLTSFSAVGAEAGRGETYSVIEIELRGPAQTTQDSPARDIDLSVAIRHQNGTQYVVQGFHAGDDIFKVRFCPTRAGRWELIAVSSNAKELNGQRVGDHILATESQQHGFWIADEGSLGQRWYRRSDGSHQYIFGNTHYSFLSGMNGSVVSGNDIAADIQANAKYFKKLRFSLTGDRYPNPAEKPFLDDAGIPTDSGDFSHRPNPTWFRERVDLAVKTAFTHDLIADLILAGPDTEDSRATLRAAANGGNAKPYLRYVAARYGSYPNVWLCLCNEYDIKKPLWSEFAISEFGSALKGFLPYPTPLSVHASQHPDKGPKEPEQPAWATKFDALPPWNDHQIIQRKLRAIGPAADIAQLTWQPRNGFARNKPTINDELSYQGEGDQHSAADTIAAHLGTFLGGGYGSTGEKHGNKLGQYFWGKFDPAEHSAARNLAWIREQIDEHITFWKMAPDATIFPNLDSAFRAMSWPGNEYVLGTDKMAEITAELPAGIWSIRRFNLITREALLVSPKASGKFTFTSPASRAVLFHFKQTPALNNR